VQTLLISEDDLWQRKGREEGSNYLLIGCEVSCLLRDKVVPFVVAIAVPL
jgi:hypothetical protein